LGLTDQLMEGAPEVTPKPKNRPDRGKNAITNPGADLSRSDDADFHAVPGTKIETRPSLSASV
jgi:hypothetical protein